jgi:hypothetical protein
MKAYSFDEFGLYQGKVECQLDKLESKLQGKEIYLLPARATKIEPPILAEDEQAKFDGSQWLKEKKPVKPIDTVDLPPTEEEIEHQKQIIESKDYLMSLNFEEIKQIEDLFEPFKKIIFLLCDQ